MGGPLCHVVQKGAHAFAQKRLEKIKPMTFQPSFVSIFKTKYTFFFSESTSFFCDITPSVGSNSVQISEFGFGGRTQGSERLKFGFGWRTFLKRRLYVVARFGVCARCLSVCS